MQNSLQESPVIYIAVIGWCILYWLNNRTLRRAETSRIKDRLIENIESAQVWSVEASKSYLSNLLEEKEIKVKQKKDEKEIEKEKFTFIFKNKYKKTEKEIEIEKETKNKEKTDERTLILEEVLEGKAVKIRFNIDQLNHYSKTDIATSKKFTEFRNFEFNEKISENELSILLFDLIVDIESSYDNFYYKTNVLSRLWITRSNELLGACFSLAILVLYASYFFLINN